MFENIHMPGRRPVQQAQQAFSGRCERRNTALQL
jgi:hypothetical protein